MARKKVLRKLYAFLAREFGHERTPSVGNAVPLPLVDRLDSSVVSFRTFTPKSACDGCPAAKLVDQRRVFVLHGRPSIRKIFGTSSGSIAEISFDANAQKFRHDPVMAWKGESPDYKKECGARLRRAREAVGYSALKAFADDTQTDQDNLSNWERGISLVPPAYVSLIKRIFGIDHAWIYDEDASALPGPLRKQLLTKDRRKAG